MVPTGLAVLVALLSASAHVDAVAAVAARCTKHCLTCDSSGSCTSCEATYGLTKAHPRRCRPCEGGKAWACLDCNDDHKKCSRCGLGNLMYLATNGSCLRCTYDDGPCDPRFGCRPDGQCIKCGRGDFHEYTWIFDTATQKLQCQLPPDGCDAAQTRTDGTCRKCRAGYVTVEGGTCKRCPDYCSACSSNLTCTECATGFKLMPPLGQCKPCTDSNCADCSGDVSVCKKCRVSNGGAKDGKCVPCADENCNDCSADHRVCTNCMENFVAKGRACVPCNQGCTWCPPSSGGCRWASGDQFPPSCTADGVCLACGTGLVRVGKQCKKCTVKRCLTCAAGNSSRCVECESLYSDNLGVAQLYPAGGGSKCSRCARPMCLECRGQGGPCTKCPWGWGAIKGECRRCKIKGCLTCNGDVDACTDCGGDDCNNEKFYDWDPRTKACVALGGTSGSCYYV